MRKFILDEVGRFKALGTSTYNLLAAYLFLSPFYPLISVFVDTFLWSHTSSRWVIIIYNLGHFLILPVSYYFSGLLLKKISLAFIYSAGLLLVAFSVMCSYFAPFGWQWQFFIFGILFGAGTGMYWSARNILTVENTTDEKRDYFSSTSSIFETISWTLLPPAAGITIVYFAKNSFLQGKFGYLIVYLFTFVFMFISALILLKNHYVTPKIVSLKIPKITFSWFRVQVLHFAIGAIDGVSFLSTLLILTFLGNELVLGGLVGLFSVIEMIFLYFYGKLKINKKRMQIYLIASFLLIIFSLLLFIPGKIFVIIYLLSSSIPLSLMWVIMDPWTFGILDDQDGKNDGFGFAYILNKEIFFNLGRILGVGILAFLLYRTNLNNSLRVTPLIIYLLQFGLALFASGVLIRKNWKQNRLNIRT